MTPQLQQAIRLLQLSTLDLHQEIQQALDSNLMLELEEEGEAREEFGTLEGQGTEPGPEEALSEPKPDEAIDLGREDYLPEDLPVDAQWDDAFDAAPQSGSASARDDDDGNDYLLQRSAAPSLRDHLYWQLNLLPLPDIDRVIATTLIDAIDEDGYLTADLKDVALAQGNAEVGVDEVHAVLSLVQSFDPPGVGARDLGECLIIQLRQFPSETPWRADAMRRSASMRSRTTRTSSRATCASR